MKNTRERQSILFFERVVTDQNLTAGLFAHSGSLFFCEKTGFSLIRAPFTPGEKFPDTDFPILSVLKVGGWFSPDLK